MIEAIRRCGILPFFKGAVPGWSVEEMTAEGCWFTDSEEFGGTLGPWDWKIDCVREGDIAYGKFLGGKAGFATVEYYRHLMNWRRSLPKYSAALGRQEQSAIAKDTLGQQKHGAVKNDILAIAPVALEAIREAGALEGHEIRRACESALPQITLKKSLMDSVLQYLQMGTWTVIGDFRRVYRGADLSYNGWQRAANTTPEALFGSDADDGAAMPAWAAQFLRNERHAVQEPDCSPLQSREFLITHILNTVPGAERRKIENLI